MKKIVSLCVFAVAFLFATTFVTAQTEQQNLRWEVAQSVSNELGDSAKLDEMQKAHVKRYVYNYHERLEAVGQNIPNFPYQSKADVTAQLEKELQAILSPEQMAVFNDMKKELLAKKPGVGQ